MPRRPKVQREIATVLRRASFTSPFEITLRKRIDAWACSDQPISPAELSARWSALKTVLAEVRPSWRWASMKTFAGGWTTTARMHVLEQRCCVFGCARQPDSFPHYLSCPALLRLLWSPEPPLLQSTLTAWGLGPAAAYVPDPSDDLSLQRTVQRVVLAYHMYNKQKLAEDSSPNVLAASLNAARALLFR